MKTHVRKHPQEKMIRIGMELGLNRPIESGAQAKKKSGAGTHI